MSHVCWLVCPTEKRTNTRSHSFGTPSQNPITFITGQVTFWSHPKVTWGRVKNNISHTFTTWGSHVESLVNFRPVEMAWQMDRRRHLQYPHCWSVGIIYIPWLFLLRSDASPNIHSHTSTLKVKKIFWFTFQIFFFSNFSMTTDMYMYSKPSLQRQHLFPKMLLL